MDGWIVAAVLYVWAAVVVVVAVIMYPRRPRKAVTRCATSLGFQAGEG